MQVRLRLFVDLIYLQLSVFHRLFFQWLLVFHFCERFSGLFIFVSKFTKRDFDFVLDSFVVHLIYNVLAIFVKLWRKNLVDMIRLVVPTALSLDEMG